VIRTCGTSSQRSTRTPGRRGRLIAVWGAALAMIISTGGPAWGASPKPRPQNLWRSYPLDSAHTGHRAEATDSPTRGSAPQPQARASRSSGGDGWLVAVGLAAAATVAVVLAGIMLRLRGVVPALSRNEMGFARRATPKFRLPQGGTIMNEKRKLWSRGDESEQLQEEAAVAGSPTNDQGLAERVLAATASGATSTPDAPPADAAVAGAEADPADVGAEVETILKSAQEAAARIRQKAHEEATKIREEAETTRAEAETFAGQARVNVQREANQMLEAARKRIAEADAVVERKLREAEGEALRRRDALQTEAKRYEERLRKMLGVFRGMSSELEELLGERTDETAADEEASAGVTLERALQPNSPSARRI
jgi:hypothetical protein